MERELPLKYLPERYYRYEVSGLLGRNVWKCILDPGMSCISVSLNNKASTK